MELLKINNCYIAYQRQGNNRNGNPLYIINIFKKSGDRYQNINNNFDYYMDKYYNIKITSYNILDTIKNILKEDKSMIRFEVDYTDNTTGATSAIDTITASEDYTAADYIKDCEENADADYITMLKNGVVKLARID